MKRYLQNINLGMDRVILHLSVSSLLFSSFSTVSSEEHVNFDSCKAKGLVQTVYTHSYHAMPTYIHAYPHVFFPLLVLV